MKKDNKQSMRQEKISKWRKFARKRWVYPAVYLGLAAIVIASVLWMQVDVNKDNYAIDEPKTNNANQSQPPIAYKENPEAVPANAMKEIFKWPVQNKDAIQVQKKFYSFDSSLEDQQAALVLNDNTYRPNTGINLAAKDGESFAVTAALSGTVVQAEKDPELGYVVRLDNGKDVTTLYSSLKSLAVEKGQQVEQGDKLGMAGNSEYFQDAGVVLHFEIRKNGVPVNPVAYFGKAQSDLKSPDKSGDDQKDKGNKDGSEMKKDQGTSGSGNPDQGTGDQQKQDMKKKTDDNSDDKTSKSA
ncbi:MAG TPA: M23 family metallopeptidase [Bacillales bacterium]|nr:M23 family metallopeptidase [Bacillales bacterium]